MDKPLQISGIPLLHNKRRRVWEIDFLRGFCIILMALDHMMFDFMALPVWATNAHKVHNPFFTFMARFATDSYWSSDWRICIRVVVVCIFLALSGISGTFSKNNGLRALKLSAAAIALSCATIFIDNVADLGVTILFGILHCLALSVVLYALVKALGGRYAKYFYIGIGILLVLLGLSINYYWIPELTHYPESLGDVLRLIIGTQYYGADCFGILPYTGIFFLGAATGETFYKNKSSLLPRLDGNWNKPLCFIGRNTIWVYLAHQPVILGLIAGIAMLCGYTFF